MARRIPERPLHVRRGRRDGQRWRYALVAVGATAATVSTAMAQTALDDAVANRPRPDFDAQCFRAGADPDIEAGGVVVCPSVGFTTRYEDNVFRDSSGEESDLSARVSPRVSVATDWDAHAVTLTGTVNATRYADQDNNDSTDYGVAGSGRLDITEGLTTTLGLTAGRFHRDRGDRDSRSNNTQDVEEFTRTSQTLGLSYAPSDLSIDITVGAVQLNYSDTNGVDNDDQDRDEYTAGIRAGLDLGSGLSLFVRPQVDVVRYDRSVGGISRDSDGYDVQGGVSYDLSGVTFVEVGVGGFSRDFDDPTFSDTSGASVSGRVVWNPTDLQTVTLTADRGLEETADAGASSVVETNIRAAIDFDVADNVLLNTGVDFANEAFEDDPRDDDTWSVRLGAQYFVNERLRATIGAEHQRRRSNIAGNDFDANTLSLGLNLQF